MVAKQLWGFFWRKAPKEAAEPADKPGSVLDSHSSRRNVAVTLEQPTRTRRGPRHEVPIWSCSRWGLPYRSVARLAVRSYRTISPLPRVPKNRSAVSFCCTFRRLAPPRRYLAPCPVEPGLSSALLRVTRLSGRLRHAHCRTHALTSPETTQTPYRPGLTPAPPATAATSPTSALSRPRPPTPHRANRAPRWSTAGRRARPAISRPPPH